MKICPYCKREIPREETKCPGCGKEYWLPGKTEEKNSAEKETEEARELGCFQILVIPLIIALLSFFFMISGGIIINLFVNFESNQIKIIWIGASLLAGLIIYLLFSKVKKKWGK